MGESKGDLKEEIIGKATGALGKKPGESISEVKQAAEDMNVVDKTIETARRLAGTDGLSKQIENKDAQLAKAGEEKDKLKDELRDTQIQLIQKELGGKIDQLSEAIKGGASPKSISDQITEVKKAADSLGLGGSKVSEIKEIMDLVTKLSPQQKGLADQVKEARELITILQPAEKKEALFEGVPASIALQLKEMDTNLKITLEKMADERLRRDQEFKLTIMEFEQNRTLKEREVEGKIAAEQDRNKILAGGLEIIGRAAGKAIGESMGGAAAEPGTISQKQPNSPKIYEFPAAEGASGEVKCPNCNTKVGIGPTTLSATCVGCGSQFRVERVPATEPTPPVEE